MPPNGKYQAAIASMMPKYTPPGSPEEARKRTEALKKAFNGVQNTVNGAR